MAEELLRALADASSSSSNMELLRLLANSMTEEAAPEWKLQELHDDVSSKANGAFLALRTLVERVGHAHRERAKVRERTHEVRGSLSKVAAVKKELVQAQANLAEARATLQTLETTPCGTNGLEDVIKAYRACDEKVSELLGQLLTTRASVAALLHAETFFDSSTTRQERRAVMAAFEQAQAAEEARLEREIVGDVARATATPKTLPELLRAPLTAKGHVAHCQAMLVHRELVTMRSDGVFAWLVAVPLNDAGDMAVGEIHLSSIRDVQVYDEFVGVTRVEEGTSTLQRLVSGRKQSNVAFSVPFFPWHAHGHAVVAARDVQPLTQGDMEKLVRAVHVHAPRIDVTALYQVVAQTVPATLPARCATPYGDTDVELVSAPERVCPQPPQQFVARRALELLRGHRASAVTSDNWREAVLTALAVATSEALRRRVQPRPPPALRGLFAAAGNLRTLFFNNDPDKDKLLWDYFNSPMTVVPAALWNRAEYIGVATRVLRGLFARKFRPAPDKARAAATARGRDADKVYVPAAWHATMQFVTQDAVRRLKLSPDVVQPAMPMRAAAAAADND